MSLPPVSDAAAIGGSVLPGAVGSPAPWSAPRPSQGLTELREPSFATAPPPRAQPSVGAAKPLVVAVPTPTPRPPRTSHSLRGTASYYCWAGSSACTYSYPDGGGFDAYAAAGPKLRAAIGPGWRGKVVVVDGIAVKLIDWCQCYEGRSNEKLLDLYHDVYVRTGSAVVVRW